MLELAIFFCVAATVGLIGLTLYEAFWTGELLAFFPRKRLEKRTKISVQLFSSLIKSYAERFELLRNHTEVYELSLQAGTQSDLDSFGALLKLLRVVAHDLETLLANHDAAAASAILAVVQGGQPGFRVNQGMREKLSELKDWEARLEELLQRIGGDLARISNERRSLGVGTSKSTLENLRDAGIEVEPE